MATVNLHQFVYDINAEDNSTITETTTIQDVDSYAIGSSFLILQIGNTRRVIALARYDEVEIVEDVPEEVTAATEPEAPVAH